MTAGPRKDLREFSSGAEMKAFYKALEARVAKRKPPLRKSTSLPPPPPAQAKPPPPPPLRPNQMTMLERIIEETCIYFGITRISLVSPRRHRAIAVPRAIAMHLAYEMLKKNYDVSTTVIGRVFHRDHSTVIHAINSVRRRKSDPLIGEAVAAIRANVEARTRK
jgi:Bacterial dnaA protein helix-turn-helix